MQLPSIVKQMGKVEGDHLVYIEDYVYTYLNELKSEKNVWPCRVALFGKAGRRDNKCYHFVYGAAGVVEEMEAGRSQEQVREEFFDRFDLIGYVNIYGNGRALPGKKDGYYIFYESNEAMQAYLLSRCERKRREEEIPEEKEDKPQAGSKGLRTGFSIGSVLKQLFYGSSVMILATAVTTIDGYDKMRRFAELIERALIITQTKG